MLSVVDKRGILLPFRITPGHADIALGRGDDLRSTRIGTILGMRATSAGSIGELSWDPDRGSKLDALRNAAASAAIADFAALYLDEAFAQALPEEALREVAVEIDKTAISITASSALVTDRSRAPTLLTTTTVLRR